MWLVFALEVWDIGRAMARTVLPPPQGQSLIPDVPHGAACSPLLERRAHRIKYVRQAYEYCLSKPRVRVWDDEHILEWFAKTTGLQL